MTFSEDLARMSQLCRDAESGATTIYSAGGEVMRLFRKHEAAIGAAAAIFNHLADSVPREAQRALPEDLL